MENDAFQPTPKEPSEPPHSSRKDPYAEPPVKDFSHLLNGKPAPKRHTARNIFLVVLLLIVLGGGAGVYWKFFYTKPVVYTKQQTKKAQPTTSSTVSVPTKSYTSAGFGVTFNYPKTWAISDGGSASLSIVSPVMKLTDANGKMIDGKIIILFQPQGQIPSSFGTSSAVAVLNSQVIKYNSPSSSQAAQAYLSFVQYASASVVGTLNGIYVTGNYGYQKDGVIPQSDLASLNPLITVTFGQCTSTACSSLESLSVSANAWNSSEFATPILDTLKSLTFS
jgi:hypothetical protein